MRGGHRSPNSWRYQVIKRYRRRAFFFREYKCKTIEEKMAWSSVIQWFDSILKNKRLNYYDVIVLPEVDLEKLDEEFFSMEFDAQVKTLQSSKQEGDRMKDCGKCVLVLGCKGAWQEECKGPHLAEILTRGESECYLF